MHACFSLHRGYFLLFRMCFSLFHFLIYIALWQTMYHRQVFHSCHDTSNPGALAADLRMAVEKDIRIAHRSKNGLLAP